MVLVSRSAGHLAEVGGVADFDEVRRVVVEVGSQRKRTLGLEVESLAAVAVPALRKARYRVLGVVAELELGIAVVHIADQDATSTTRGELRSLGEL